MKVTVYSSHNFDKQFLLDANQSKHELVFVEPKLTMDTVDLAKGSTAVCLFVSDDASAPILEKLARLGVKYVALRSAGYNHIDLKAAAENNLLVARVPAYSPNSVAEHTIALILALNRNLILADQQIKRNNFSLDNLVGFNLAGKTAGVIGTGKIGSIVARILSSFGCKVLAYDKFENNDLKNNFKVEYTTLNSLYNRSNIITLHVPLNSETKYLINKDSIKQMREGVMLINTGRGALINTPNVIQGLKENKIRWFGADVYEKEEPWIFEDHSKDEMTDPVLKELMSFKNVLVTGHQAFLTDEALMNIGTTTIYNLDCFAKEEVTKNYLNY